MIADLGIGRISEVPIPSAGGRMRKLKGEAAADGSGWVDITGNYALAKARKGK
jgi:hypothetical protein